MALPRNLTRQDLEFGFKYFLAVALDFLFCGRFGLEQPQWAAITTMIVFNPIAGAQASKSFYRLLGTSSGAVIAVLLFALLGASQEFLLFGMAVVVGVGGALRSYDPSPRGYMYMLAAYTVPIIGLPALVQPGEIPLQAINRVSEISIGILSTFVISSVFPQQPVVEPLRQLLAGWLLATRKELAYLLRAYGHSQEGNPGPHQTVIDAGTLNTLAFHIRFETGSGPLALLAGNIQRSTRLLVPRLFGLRERLIASHRGRTPGAALNSLLVHAEEALAGEGALRAIGEDFAAKAKEISLTQMEDASVCVSLGRILQVLGHLDAARHALGGLREGTTPEPNPDVDFNARAYRDHRRAMITGAIGFLTFGVACFLWKLTLWPSGASMVTFSAVGCLVYSHLDEPTGALSEASWGLVVCAIISGFFVYGIYPYLESPWQLLGASALLFTLLGVFAKVSPMGAFSSQNVPALAGFQNAYVQPEFSRFLESSAALICGFLIALALFRLTRFFTNRWLEGALQKEALAQLRRLMQKNRPGRQRFFLKLSVERLDRVFGQKISEEALVRHHRVLAETNFGLNLIQFQNNYRKNPRAELRPLVRALRAPESAEWKVAVENEFTLLFAKISTGEMRFEAAVEDSLVGMKLMLEDLA